MSDSAAQLNSMLGCPTGRHSGIGTPTLAYEMIRKLQNDTELRQCVALLRAAFGTVAAEFGLTQANAPTNPAFVTLESLMEHLNKPVSLYGLYQDDKLVGCVAIQQSKQSKDTYYIERLAVDPDKRHQGIGTMLLAFAFRQILKNGGTTASIGIMDNNQRLKLWYQMKGFTQTGIKDYEHLPFRVCFMSKSLNEDPKGRGIL